MLQKCLLRGGYFFPYGEDGPIDIIGIKEKKIIKLQIKASKPKKGSIPCKLRSTNNWQDKKYAEENIDSFGLSDYENKKGYLIPIKNVKGMSEIRLRVERSKNNQSKNVRDAKEYLYFE